MTHRTRHTGAPPPERHPAAEPPATLRAALGRYGGQISLIAVSSLSIAALLVGTNGSLFITIALLTLAGIVIVSSYRIDIGFYILVGCVLAFDQYPIPGFNPLTASTGYFLNLKELPHLGGFGAGVVNPLELHLLLLAVVWMLTMIARQNFSVRRVPVWGSALIFFLALLLAFANGMTKGGDMLPALWEIRALFYLGILYFFTPQVIRTREQLAIFFWVCMIVISFKAFQGLERFLGAGFSFQGWTTLTNHEDALFIVSLFIMLFGLWFWKSQPRQRWFLTLLLPVLLGGFYAAQRRAAYAAMAATALMIVVLVTKQDRLRFLRMAIPAAAAIALYCAVFWESDSPLAAPVKLVKSGITLDKETAGERYFSNLYRENERYDLAVTARNAPVTGIGFGRKYEQPIKLFKIPFTLRDYISHNAILWLFVKMGALGFYFFCFFLDSFIVYGASLYARLKDPYLRTACIVILTAIVNQIVVSYYDLQLTYYRNMVYLGALMGMLPVIESLHRTALAEAGQDEPSRRRWRPTIASATIPARTRTERVFEL